MSSPRSRLSNENLDYVLKGQMAADITEAISRQPSPFERGEKLVLVGSSLPYLMGHHGSIVLPRYRPPSDLDFCLEDVQPDHRKHSLIHTRNMGMLLEKVGEENGYKVSPFSFNGSHFTVEKFFAPEEIKRALQSGNSGRHLARFPMDYDAITEGRNITLDIQFIPFLTSMLSPRPLTELDKGAAPHAMALYGDDLRNTVAVKLARMMLVPDQVKGQTENKTLNDLTDVYNILHSSENVRQEILEDPKLLRLLALAFMSAAPSSCLQQSAMLFAPTMENKEKFKKLFNEKYKIVLPNKDVTAMLETADDLLGKMFPERSAAKPFPISPNEKSFIEQIENAYMPKTEDNIRTDLLKQDYPEIFHKHPELEANIRTNGFIVERVQEEQTAHQGLG